MVDRNSDTNRLTTHDDLGQIMRGLQSDELLAVVVFGSVARNTATQSSDLDVLIVVESDSDRTSALQTLRDLPELAHLPMVFTRASIQDQTRARPSFILHLVEEGIDLYSTDEWRELRAELSRAASQPEALEKELRNRSATLRLFRDPERYASSPITALSHLYALGRSVVIVKLLQRGIHEFDWRDLFDTYAAVRPDLAEELDAVQNLRPFYDFARDRSPTKPTIRGRRDDVVRQMAHAVEQLAS